MIYSLHPEAESDLREAADYYRERAGITIAQAFFSDFEQSITLLLEYPLLGALWLPGKLRLVMKARERREPFEWRGEYIYEPARERILASLLPRHLNFHIWRVLLESNAAEQGARMAAMDNATENARELIEFLQLQYNKARQASITKELLEVVSGAEALREAR